MLVHPASQTTQLSTRPSLLCPSNHPPTPCFLQTSTMPAQGWPENVGVTGIASHLEHPAREEAQTQRSIVTVQFIEHSEQGGRRGWWSGRPQDSRAETVDQAEVRHPPLLGPPAELQPCPRRAAGLPWVPPYVLLISPTAPSPEPVLSNESPCCPEQPLSPHAVAEWCPSRLAVPGGEQAARPCPGDRCTRGLPRHLPPRHP